MKTLDQQIQQFKEETGYSLELKDGKPYYGDDLYLGGTPITTLPDHLTVEGDLDLLGSPILFLPDHLTVRGGLGLIDTSITSLPNSLTVGNSIFLEDNSLADTTQINRNLPEVLQWRSGNRHYIKVDDIFCEMVAHKDNLYKIRRIGKQRIEFLLTDGNGKWAYGSTIHEAQAQLG